MIDFLKLEYNNYNVKLEAFYNLDSHITTI